MTTLEEVRLAIGTTIKRVADVGVVHPYERYAKAEKDFAALFFWQPPTPEGGSQPARELRGWTIRRLMRREYEKNSSVMRIETDWKVSGWMALQDARASEILMDALVEQLCATFRADLTLGGIVENMPPAQGQPNGLQLVESGPYMLGSYLCHGVQLTLTTTHYQSTAADPATLGDLRLLHANWELPPRHETGPELPDDDSAVATDEIHYP